MNQHFHFSFVIEWLAWVELSWLAEKTTVLLIHCAKKRKIVFRVIAIEVSSEHDKATSIDIDKLFKDPWSRHCGDIE